MLVALIVAIFVFGLLSLPGWVAVAGRDRAIWHYVAAGFCSQAAFLLLTALLGKVLPGQTDIRVGFAVALVLACLAGLARGRRLELAMPKGDRWMLVVPVLATVVAAAITRAAIGEEGGDLVVRAWFNADGFKHLGHVYSLAMQGLPARDIFGDGDPLAYYWFFYIIPALGMSLTSDAPRSLIASGLVQTFAFWLLVHGLLRSAGANERWSALLAFAGWLSPSLKGLGALILMQGNAFAVMQSINVEGLTSGLLPGFTLFRIGLYIPQHQFMLAGLLSWGLVYIARLDNSSIMMRVLAHAPLTAAGGISALFGVACLCIYGTTVLFNTENSLRHRLVDILVTGCAALLVPLLFGIIRLSSETSGLGSPIFGRHEPDFNSLAQLVLLPAGLLIVYGVALVSLVGYYHAWRTSLSMLSSQPHGRALLFGSALTFVGIFALVLPVLAGGSRVAFEFQLRVSLLPWIGLMMGAVWLLHEVDGRQRLYGFSAGPLGIMLLMGALTSVLDWGWHGLSEPRWTVRVPADDMAVLQVIKRETSPQAIFLQAVEVPFVSGGQDVWVPVFAGRTLWTSHRATDWVAHKSRVEAARAYFNGTSPLPLGKYDYVYLSRALHPSSYDRLNRNLSEDKQWRRLVYRRSACLWQKT